MNVTSENSTYYLRCKDIIKQKKLQSIMQRIKKR